MKWCVEFPEESVLVARPSLNAICHGIKPAAKLLSVLLYRYSIRQEHKDDATNINEVDAAQGKEPAQDVSFYIFRKQSQLVADMIDEVTEKTLHDVAIPTLQLLGFLDVDETPIIHKYDLHVDIVRAALAAYKQGPKNLHTFLLQHLQLEKFLINEKLEKVLIDKKKFLLALEKVLIANRNSSNNKRGRKTRQERTSGTQSEKPQISIEIDSEIGNEEEGTGAFAQPTREEHLALKEKIRDTDYRLKAIAKGHKDGQLDTAPAPSGGATHSPTAGRLSPSVGSESRPPGAVQKPLSLTDETPRLSAKQERIQHEAHLWQVIETGLKTTFARSQRNATNNHATIEHMIEDGASDENVSAALKKLSSWERQNFKLKTFYEEWMPAKLATMPATKASGSKGKQTAYDGQTDLSVYGFGQNDEAQMEKFRKLGASV